MNLKNTARQLTELAPLERTVHVLVGLWMILQRKATIKGKIRWGLNVKVTFR